MAGSGARRKMTSKIQAKDSIDGEVLVTEVAAACLLRVRSRTVIVDATIRMPDRVNVREQTVPDKPGTVNCASYFCAPLKDI